MGNRRDVIVLGVVLFALAAIAIAVRPSGRGDSEDPRISSFLTGRNGAAALYLLLEELEIPARRDLRPWSADTSRRALVVLAPSQPASPRELRSLRAWIENGSILIYGAGGTSGLEALLGLRIQRTLPDTLGALATVRWSGMSGFPERHEWTAGIDSVAGFMNSFRADSRALSGPGAEILLRTREGDATVVSFPLGEGRVVAWSDASVLGNRALRSGDAALLFARAATMIVGKDGELRFDEYHHGYREAKPLRALASVLTRTGGGRALLQGVVACLVLLLLAGARFGAPIQEHSERRRSPIEHMQALAGAYERSAARTTARRLLLAGMERQLGRRVIGDGAVLPPAALAGTAAGRRLRHEWERGTDGDLAELARAVDEFVMEVRRWK